MFTFTISIIASFIAGVLLALVSLVLFDKSRLLSYLNKFLPFSVYRSFSRVSSRQQLRQLFAQVFINIDSAQEGKIYLMSGAGGYPSYDPYVRIIELVATGRYEVFVAVNVIPFKEWATKNPERCHLLVQHPNIHLYVFDNLVPYNFRIGLNTALKFGFFCTFLGYQDNKVVLDGIKTENPLMIRAIEILFNGLLDHGQEITSENTTLIFAK